MIYITRHGESMTNAGHHKRSPFELNINNNVLTKIGVKQALEEGENLLNSGVHIDQIVASPYSRTKQTAFLIASSLETCVPIDFDYELREIHWEYKKLGKFENFDHLPNFDEFYDNIDSRPHPESESQRDVFSRVIPAILDIQKRYEGKNILLVTHYFVVRSVLSFKSCGKPDEMPTFDPKNLQTFSFETL